MQIENQTNNSAWRYDDLIRKSHRLTSPQVAASGGDMAYVLWTEVDAVLTKAPQYPRLSESGNASEAAAMKNSSLTVADTFSDFSFRDLLPKYDANVKVFFRASNDSGKTFDNAIMILNVTENWNSPYSFVRGPTLVASGNNVYIIASTGGEEELEDRILYLFRSTDNGMTFEEKKITVELDSVANIKNATALFPVYAYPAVPGNDNSNTLYMLVTMAENTTKSIIEERGAKLNPAIPPFFDLAYSGALIRSDDAGANFTDAVPVINQSRMPLGATRGVSQNDEMVYLAWTDPGLNVSDFLRLSIQSGKYVSPQELEELNTAGSILLRASNDRGNTFGDNPDLLVPFKENGLYVIKTRTVYYDSMQRILPSSEILLWRSANGTESIEGPIKINGNIEGSRFGWSFLGPGNPATALTSDGLYVVWSGEDATGYHDVYLRRIMN